MFMPPWYPPISIRFEPTSKLPYQKLQYPTYVKDINHDAHIKKLKKQLELMGKLWRLISSTYFVHFMRDNIAKWGKKFV
jgi:hypothetical protein